MYTYGQLMGVIDFHSSFEAAFSEVRGRCKEPASEFCWGCLGFRVLGALGASGLFRVSGYEGPEYFESTSAIW